MKYLFTATALLAFCSGSLAVPTNVPRQVAEYDQCGGSGYTGSTTCAAPYVCTYQNEYYSQCLLATTTTTTTATTTSSITTTTLPASTGTVVTYAGINIPGFEFSMDVDGNEQASQAEPPLIQYSPVDGLGQMTHFVKDDHFNLFRLPVAWQYLTNDVPTGTLDTTNFPKYDTLVQDCLNLGATCIIDIHNYARWNGEIIGQGGPDNPIFADLWSNLATYYADEDNIIFGVMNEPHEVNVTLWADTVQAAVTAIRSAGATSQYILLPGSDYASAASLVSDGSGPALLSVTNPDGSTNKLVFDVHQYSDFDNSGTHPDCVTNNTENAFGPLATWLRTNLRQAFNTEFGGGNNDGCVTDISQQLQFLNDNTDVFLGWTGWAAGSINNSSAVEMVPTYNNGVWTDTQLVAQALVPNFHP